MMAAWKGRNPYNTLTPKAASGTQGDPNRAPTTDQPGAGCVSEEDHRSVSWFWLHPGATLRWSNCETHFKWAPHQLAY